MKRRVKQILKNMLPDYVQGDLQEEDKIFFEREIVRFQDLLELKDKYLNLTKHINQIDYEKIFEKKSNYALSLSKNKIVENAKRTNSFIKWVPYPVAIIVLLTFSLYFFIKTPEKKVDLSNKANNEVQFEESLKIDNKFANEYAKSYPKSKNTNTRLDISLDEVIDITLSDRDLTEVFFDDIYNEINDSPELMHFYTGESNFKIDESQINSLKEIINNLNI